ncbi:unnamed protein product [Clonostachys rhizophaga]|uniref:Ribosomal protein L34 n=1 Tax=Clonostachys rhizophaga TaxID=160324 RepID=A0A9N9V9E8_9HYPO|nr:unnamed protein product [Clonostachys rhizophaga]
MNTIARSAIRLVRPAFSKPSVRTFTSFTPLRPTLQPQPAFRPNVTSFTPSVTESAAADVVPNSAITSNPALGSVRFGPRNTMNGHTRLVQKRRHGFLARKRSRTGRKILQRRRNKGRRQLAQ